MYGPGRRNNSCKGPVGKSRMMCFRNWGSQCGGYSFWICKLGEAS